MTRKTYVLYHDKCFDGFGSAWAFDMLNPDKDRETVYLPCSYGDHVVPCDPQKDDHVYIFDFSFPREVLIKLNKSVEKLLVLDHHITAKEDLEGLSFTFFDMDRSGAMITWEHFCKDSAAPPLISYIQDRDLWRFKLPYSNEINAYIQSHDFTFEEFYKLNDELTNPSKYHTVISSGKAILKTRQKTVNMICDNAHYIIINGEQVPCVNATVFQSDVGHELLRRFDVPYVGVYSFLENKVKWSLRSVPDFDCRQVAEFFGGGGHKNAAGFIMEINGNAILSPLDI